MKSLITKRSIVVAGHKTSISLESPFWDEFREIARASNMGLSTLVSTIDRERGHGNLSSAIRLFVLAHYRHAVLQRSIEDLSGTDATPEQRSQAR